MKAKQILGTISPEMTKGEILALIAEAKAELKFLNSREVAELLGKSIQLVQRCANNHVLGTRPAPNMLIFSPGDIEDLSARIALSGRSAKTLNKSDRAKELKAKGLTNTEISRAIREDLSYVGRLLTM